MSEGPEQKKEEDKAEPGKVKIDPKELRKQARLAEEQARLKEKRESALQFQNIFGKSPMIQSTSHKSRPFKPIQLLTSADANNVVVIRARVHNTRKKGKLAFLILRSANSSIQAMVSVGDTIPKEMVDFCGSIALESVVDVEGVVKVVDQPIVSTTQSALEIMVQKVHVVSEAAGIPFGVEDGQRRADSEGTKVGVDTRLCNRWMDLRTRASNAIFKIQSRVGQHFRQFLIDKDFTEIHSPKIIATASEGGANVFKLDYFGKAAYLAQSPQLYKQMVVQGDLLRVFEVAPVFRAENTNSHRHLTEFVGLDVEMAINEHYYEVLDLAEELFGYIFHNLVQHRQELDDVKEQYPFSPLVWQVAEDTIKELGVGRIEEGIAPTDIYGARVRNSAIGMLRIPYANCVALLNTVLDEKLDVVDDINTANEKKLGALVKARYGVEWFISDRFPSVARPFYTMPCLDDSRFTNSYDMFIRGEEISSGAQRIHDADMLLERAAALNVDLTPIKDYVTSFRLGAWPHGGFGVGLERVAMLYLGLSNIRYASLFPRDPSRVTP